MANFAAYQSRGQLAAPEVHFTKPVGVSYDNPGERALARVNADTAGVIVKGYENWKEQYDSGKVMEANNEYNRLMSEGTAELMQKKQENALNIVQDYDKLHQKALDQVRKKFGAFINYGKPGQAFNIYTERDNNTRRQHMMKYQMAETEAYHETQFNNQLASCQQMAADGGYSDLSIDEGLNRAEGFIEARYAQYGKEMIEQQKRVFKGDIVSSALALAMKMEDYSRMGQLAVKYSDYLDAKTRISVLATIGKRQKDAYERQEANAIEVALGDNATREDYLNYFLTQQANYGDVKSRFGHYNSLLGQEMPNGRNGCVEGFLALTAPFFGFSADNKSEVNVGRMCQLASNTEGVRLERYNGGEIPEGCGIIYFSEGDDISDFGNAEHITMADGNGGFYGNSSSAKDYEDENGNYVRGNGCIIHSDDQNIGGYKIGYIIRMDQQTMQAMSELDAEEKADKAWALHQKRMSEKRAVENRIIGQGHDAMQDLMNHGVTDIDQYQAVVNQYAYMNGEVNDHVRIELEKTVAAIERRNERAAKQGARRQPSEKVNETDMELVRDEISMGRVDEAAITNYCAQRGITSATEINKLQKLLKDYKNNKGEWAIPYDDIKAYCDIDERMIEDKKSFNKTFKRIARFQYYKMLADNKGQLFSGWEEDLADRVAKAFTEEYHGGQYVDKGTWMNTEENVILPYRILAANGYDTIRQTGDDGYVLESADGKYAYMSGEDIMKLKDLSGYRK